jgi:serine/threonine protein kinase
VIGLCGMANSFERRSTVERLAWSRQSVVGKIISHDRIEEKLGEGGMGVVYRARDTLLPRNAAIKFLSRDVATEDQRHRFQQQSLPTARLIRFLT